MRTMAPKLVVLALALVCLTTRSTPAAAQATNPAASAAQAIRYTVSFPAPHTHYIEIAATVPTGGRPDIEMMMAVWTPGSYLIREYERNIERVAASTSGRSVPVDKTDKNRWRVVTGGAETVTVSYSVYAREMSVRTNWVDAGFALINGAPTFMTLADSAPRPHEVVLNLPAAWRRSMTGLRALPGGTHRYVADNFDTLVDSPILAGNPAVYEFTVDGKPHYLVNEGEGGVFDGTRAARDFERLVRENLRFWGQLPYDKYVVLNVIGESRGGGLEHGNSTVLIASRWTTRTRSAYASWLSTLSHEIFHIWNGKRLRPAELGPFDYENEAHTRSLWVVEGFSDYYESLLAHRAGLITRDEFLANLSSSIDEVQASPGRLVQSVELASFDAWIKYYRPDENSPNVSISYYSKGHVLAFLLDARIRRATKGARSLDDVMRAAYARYSGTRGFTPDQFREVAEQVAGATLRGFWDTSVSGTAELDYEDALATYGLRFESTRTGGNAWLGVSTRNDQGRLVVSEVLRDTPGMAAGVNVDDEILAIDDFRVRADQLTRRLEQYRAGDRVTVLVARREQLLRLDLVLGSEPPRAWYLQLDLAATEAQRTRLNELLRSQP